ncbi:type IV pilus modification protein PilV [Undibacterium sp. SXout11W]|uniref:type IV pilus modification protein PilV n=1 Tax=Undibacterium sp. SXout11W TaxID=3413050 RepID=UPI003BEF6EA6
MCLKKNCGFSLLEVLISIVILSLTALGAVGLQLDTLQTSRQAAYHSIAVALANELAEEMRSNEAQMKLPDGENLFSSIKYDSRTDNNPPKSSTCYTSSANCGPVELARADIYEWLSNIQRSLPGGRVVVCRDAEPYSEAKASLKWSCSSDARSGFVIKIGWNSKKSQKETSESNEVATPHVAIPVESYVR